MNGIVLRVNYYSLILPKNRLKKKAIWRVEIKTPPIGRFVRRSFSVGGMLELALGRIIKQLNQYDF